MTRVKSVVAGILASFVLEQLAVRRSGLPSLRHLAKREGVTTWSAWQRGLPGARRT
jgi:hypothetical protein